MSPLVRRSNRGGAGSRKAAKLTDTEDSNPLASPRSPNAGQENPMSSTHSGAASPTSTLASPRTTEVKSDKPVEGQLEEATAAPQQPISSTNQTLAPALPKPDDNTTKKPTQPLPEVMHKPTSHGSHHHKRFEPYKLRKPLAPTAVPSTPNDFDLCEAVRDVSEVVTANAVTSALDGMFPEYKTALISRPQFVAETYRVMSI